MTTQRLIDHPKDLYKVIDRNDNRVQYVLADCYDDMCLYYASVNFKIIDLTNYPKELITEEKSK